MQQQSSEIPIHTSSIKLSKKASFSRQINTILEYLQLQLNLTQEQAKLIIYAHNCTDHVQIFNLFIKDEITNKYSHLFCPDQLKICLICQQPQQNHSYVSNQIFKNILQKIKKNDDISQFAFEKIQQKQSCSICYSQFSTIQIVKYKDQNHQICIECFKSFLTQEINIARVSDLRCPHCSLQLDGNFIQQIVDKKTYKKYKIFLRNNLIQNDPQLRWCPNPKCGKIIKLKSKKKQQAKCQCGIIICIKCNRQRHSGQSCDQIFKNQIKQWSEAIDLQKCKKCKSLVQKVSGCNHMTCGVCKYQWCWLCSATYSPIHFSPLNPFGCPGLQNGDNRSRDWGSFKRTMYRIGIFLLILICIPILLPLSLLVSGPIVIIVKLRQTHCYYNRSRCVKFLFLIMVSILGLIFDPIIWCGLLVVYLPQGIQSLFRVGRRRRQIEAISANNLRQRLISEELDQ